MVNPEVEPEFAQDAENPDSLGMAAGRKPIPAHLRHTERVPVLLTKQERKILEKAARRDGRHELSTWIREVALRAAASATPTVPNPE